MGSMTHPRRGDFGGKFWIRQRYNGLGREHENRGCGYPSNVVVHCNTFSSVASYVQIAAKCVPYVPPSRRDRDTGRSHARVCIIREQPDERRFSESFSRLYSSPASDVDSAIYFYAARPWLLLVTLAQGSLNSVLSVKISN